MRELYNTNDRIYLDEDVLWAIRHGMNLGRSNTEITPEKAFLEWREEYSKNAMKELNFTAITEAVCAVTRIPTTDITVKTGRAKMRTRTRNLISFFAYTYLKDSVESIAERFGYKHHSSVLHGHEDVSSGIRFDKKTRVMVDDIKARLLHNEYRLVVNKDRHFNEDGKHKGHHEVEYKIVS